jgi:hypothetical protein
MKPLSKILGLFVFTLISQSSFAEPAYQIGEPVMIGNGCPQGSASAVISPGGSAISILFDRFAIDGRRGGNQWDLMRKNCRFHIPVAVTPGYTLEAVQVDYRGFANVQNNNRAVIITTGASVGLSDMVVGNERTRTELRGMTGNFLVRQAIPTLSGRCRPDNSLDLSSWIQQILLPTKRQFDLKCA